MTLQDGTLPHLRLYNVGSSNGLIMTVVEELIKKIEDWTTLDDPLRCEILADVQIWLEKEQQQLNKAWQDGAATAQSNAAKEIEKNYVARVR